MDFVKMEGLGNDFIVVDGDEPSTSDIRQWCDRRTGIGADGVLHVSASELADAVVRMRYWNSDGSLAEMCGNGLRCVARYRFDRQMTRGAEFGIETATGVKRAEVRTGGLVRVELGEVSVGEAITLEGVEFTRAAVGNPHAVTFVGDSDEAPVRTLGPLVERHGAFPAGVNVEFVTVDVGGLRLRVWERGAGETMACGTGAAAAVAVAHARGEVGPTTVVELRGGTLLVELVGQTAWITGPANTVFSGRL